MRESNLFYSALLKLLPRLKPYARGPLLRRLYWAMYDLWDSEGPPVKTKLHGFSVLLNRGNLYPFFLHSSPLFNAPLVQLVHQVARAKPSPLVFIDVGAATGDTVLLIKHRCPGAAGKFICVEGDEEFHALLAANMRQFEDVTIVNSILARKPMQVKSLVKHHAGTASCIGDKSVEAVCLDSIEAISRVAVDIIKSDVDGFDGEVIAGATNTLQRCKPAVIFEWDPRRIFDAGNEPFRAFDALKDCGYTRFCWFNNVGTFSHFSDGCSREILKKQFDYLLAVNHRAGEHFDVIALHASANLDEVELAGLGFARGLNAGRHSSV